MGDLLTLLWRRVSAYVELFAVHVNCGSCYCHGDAGLFSAFLNITQHVLHRPVFSLHQITNLSLEYWSSQRELQNYRTTELLFSKVDG